MLAKMIESGEGIADFFEINHRRVEVRERRGTATGDDGQIILEGVERLILGAQALRAAKGAFIFLRRSRPRRLTGAEEEQKAQKDPPLPKPEGGRMVTVVHLFLKPCFGALGNRNREFFAA